ncbi:LysR family transcriptional regulator [Burkholderia sp. 8Y]|uniref:LysR substrate-binding domain-containing protein n=1 Tax=Burkholderia sp. 8Y TaxID=2653133 RepID=UPI0012F245CF|nr:LysR substrate-binding domain-containing protein [Burkholderia sp. 8Y]VXC45742.1 LysR family transcriptional regulator [Burkholderia sp. 8Y]
MQLSTEPLSHDLPPLLTLRVFESVARHLSFVLAASELAVTQSAVSHQIHKLEEHLGASLFVRRTRRIELTPDGTMYYAKVRQALEWIAEGTRELRGNQKSRARLRVSLLSSFATHWLAPRLADFSAAYPEIHLQLLPSIELANVGAGGADVAIRYGEGDWKNVTASLLMAERLSPVCSPAFLAAHGPFPDASALRKGPLLMSYAQRHFEWEAWGVRFGCELSGIRSIMLHDYNIVLEAAASGHGIAMGRHRLIEKRLAAGTLVEAVAGSVYEGSIGYWLVTAEGLTNATAERFVDWIRHAAKAGEQRRDG